MADPRTPSAKDLLAAGYYQVSRKFRQLAKLPVGETGRAALARAAARDVVDAKDWAFRMGEQHAADHYLRCYADREGNCIEVDATTFAEFLRLGGGSRMRFK